MFKDGYYWQQQQQKSFNTIKRDNHWIFCFRFNLFRYFVALKRILFAVLLLFSHLADNVFESITNKKKKAFIYLLIVVDDNSLPITFINSLKTFGRSIQFEILQLERISDKMLCHIRFPGCETFFDFSILFFFVCLFFFPINLPVNVDKM